MTWYASDDGQRRMLAVTTDAGTIFLRVDQGSDAELRVYSYRWSHERLSGLKLTPDESSRHVWERWIDDAYDLACDPDGDCVFVNLCTPAYAEARGDEDPGRDARMAHAAALVLEAAGLPRITSVWLVDTDRTDDNMFVRFELQRDN